MPIKFFVNVGFYTPSGSLVDTYIIVYAASAEDAVFAAKAMVGNNAVFYATTDDPSEATP